MTSSRKLLIPAVSLRRNKGGDCTVLSIPKNMNPRPLMNPEDIKQLIETGISDAKASVTGDGSKFEAAVVSRAFEGLSTVKKHQLVYGTVAEHIASGALHALTIKAYTPEEWSAKHNNEL